jgi:hypothetical protein
LIFSFNVMPPTAIMSVSTSSCSMITTARHPMVSTPSVGIR